MMGLLLLLLLGDGADAEFLASRVKELALRYEQLDARQSPAAIRERATLVRELSHLPFEDEPRGSCGRLLARIVAEDRSYRVRAEAARGIARVGTPGALAAMYGALFGPVGREPRFELLYSVLPESLAALRHPDDLDWIAEQVLKPAAGSGDKALLREAGPLGGDLVTLTLEGLGRARARTLGPAIVPLARADDPEVRAAAVAALAALEVEDETVAAALKDPEAGLRAAAAGSRLLRPEQARTAISDAFPIVRRAAIRGLAARPEREAVTILVDRLRVEDDGRLRLDLAEALHALTGKDFGLDGDLWGGWWAAARDTYAGPVEAEAGERAYFFDVGLRTSRVTFVIDVSASMATPDAAGVSRLAHAAQELKRAVAALPPAARFRLLAFSAQVRRWPEEADEPGDRTQAAAAADVLLAQRPGGATNTYAALMLALADPFAPDAIVLLTDGSPYRCAFEGKTYSEPEQILHEVRRANRAPGVRIHAVALRSGVAGNDDGDDAEAAAYFLRRLAAENRGEFREVR